MSEHEIQFVIERLDERSRTVVEAVQVPPPGEVVLASRGSGHGRRWWLAGAAVVLVVAVLGALTLRHDDADVHTVDRPDDEPADPQRPLRLVPPAWLIEDGAEVVTSDGDDRGDRYEVATQLFAYEGRVVVLGSVSDVPLSPADPSIPGVETGVVDGRPVRWTDSHELRLSVGLEPGRTLSLASRVADRSQLEELVEAWDTEGERFVPDQLPAEWTLVDDPAGLVSTGIGLTRPASWAGVTRRPPESPGNLWWVASLVTPRAESLVEQVAQLDGRSATWADIGGRRGVVRTGYVDTMAVHSVFWAPDDSTIAVATVSDVDPSEAVELARSAQPVDPTQWAALRSQPDPDGRYHLVDGFLLSREEQIIDRGTTSGLRWIVTQIAAGDFFQSGRPPVPAEQVLTHLHLLDEAGEQLGPVTVTGASSGTSYQRGEQSVMFAATAPIALAEVTLVLDGAAIDTHQNPMHAVGELAVLAVLPARSTPEIDPMTVVVSGRFPDGSVYDSRFPPVQPG